MTRVKTMHVLTNSNALEWGLLLDATDAITNLQKKAPGGGQHFSLCIGPPWKTGQYSTVQFSPAHCSALQYSTVVCMQNSRHRECHRPMVHILRTVSTIQGGG